MNGVFIDSSAFFASLIKRDRFHEAARKGFYQLLTEKKLSVTTDHVIAETLILFRARGYNHLCKAFHDYVYGSAVHNIVYTSRDQFIESTKFFLKHADKGYSFVDCLSFVVMREKRLSEALTTDDHFNQAGFKALLVAA